MWEIWHFETSVKATYCRSQESNPSPAIMKPKFLLWHHHQKQGSSCQGQKPATQLTSIYPLLHRGFCDFHEKHKENLTLPNTLFKISFFFLILLSFFSSSSQTRHSSRKMEIITEINFMECPRKLLTIMIVFNSTVLLSSCQILLLYIFT